MEWGATGPGCLNIFNPVYIVVGVLWSGELQGLGEHNSTPGTARAITHTCVYLSMRKYAHYLRRADSGW